MVRLKTAGVLTSTWDCIGTQATHSWLSPCAYVRTNAMCFRKLLSTHCSYIGRHDRVMSVRRPINAWFRCVYPAFLWNPERSSLTGIPKDDKATRTGDIYILSLSLNLLRTQTWQQFVAYHAARCYIGSNFTREVEVRRRTTSGCRN